MRRVGIWACLLSLLASACTEKQDRPPPASGACDDATGVCFIGTPGSSGGSITPFDASMLNSPGTNPPASGDAGADSLTGDVRVLLGTGLDNLEPLSAATVEVSAPSLSGGRSTAEYDGSQPFVLSDIQRLSRVWVGVEKVSGLRALMTTLQPVDTQSGQADVLVVDRDSVEAAASSGSLLSPVTLDPGRGQALIQFVRGGSPVGGVVVESTTATTIAYDAGAAYSDAVEETSTGGSVLLLNLQAGVFPGSAETIGISFGTDVLDFDIQVAEDAITLMTVSLD